MQEALVEVEPRAALAQPAENTVPSEAEAGKARGKNPLFRIFPANLIKFGRFKKRERDQAGSTPSSIKKVREKQKESLEGPCGLGCMTFPRCQRFNNIRCFLIFFCILVISQCKPDGGLGRGEVVPVRANAGRQRVAYVGEAEEGRGAWGEPRVVWWPRFVWRDPPASSRYVWNQSWLNGPLPGLLHLIRHLMDIIPPPCVKGAWPPESLMEGGGDVESLNRCLVTSPEKLCHSGLNHLGD